MRQVSAAKTLSAKTNVEESEKAFAISIVHDVGKIIFYTYDGGYRSPAKEAALESRDVCDLERARYGIDHQEIGHLMSVKWGFPTGFSEAVKDHHSPPDGRVPVIDVVRDADAFACGSGRYLPESERIILQNEKELIGTETERIRRLVGI
jgi:HD-like signal output (HDOD) protein